MAFGGTCVGFYGSIRNEGQFIALGYNTCGMGLTDGAILEAESEKNVLLNEETMTILTGDTWSARIWFQTLAKQMSNDQEGTTKPFNGETIIDKCNYICNSFPFHGDGFEAIVAGWDFVGSDTTTDFLGREVWKPYLAACSPDEGYPKEEWCVAVGKSRDAALEVIRKWTSFHEKSQEKVVELVEDAVAEAMKVDQMEGGEIVVYLSTQPMKRWKLTSSIPFGECMNRRSETEGRGGGGPKRGGGRGGGYRKGGGRGGGYRKGGRRGGDTERSNSKKRKLEMDA